MMGAWLVLAFCDLLGFYMLGRYGADLGAAQTMMVGVGLIALLLLALLLTYASWYVYRENRIIVTNENLYQITQNSLFSRRVAQFALNRLQDVSANQSGFFASLLDYGDVTAETAGEEENFVFRQAPNPRDLAQKIVNYHEQAVEEGGIRAV
jgi:uncharacterized membrane protein YdbT with pleckstrin-like domain